VFKDHLKPVNHQVALGKDSESGKPGKYRTADGPVPWQGNTAGRFDYG
jgi:hypothetical protein